MVLVAVILIVLIVVSVSSSCGSSKILTWTVKYKPGVGARAGKYKLRAKVGKYNLGARALKYNLGARVSKYKLGTRARAKGQVKGRGPGNTKTKFKNS